MFLKNPESKNLFREILGLIFIEGCKMSFSVMINSYMGIFDLNRKLLPCRKTKQRKFREKNS